MSPIPRLKIIMQIMGKRSRKKANVKVIPSMMQKMKNTMSVSPKFIREDTFLEKRKRYFGTFILVKIAELVSREPIPPLVESVK